MGRSRTPALPIAAPACQCSSCNSAPAAESDQQAQGEQNAGSGAPNDTAKSAKMIDKQVNSGAAEQAETHQTPSQSAKLRDGNEGQNQSANNEKIPGRPNGRTTEMKESEQSSLDLTTGMFITEEKRNSTNRMLRREEFPHVLLPPSASRRRPCCRLGRPSDLPVGLISRAHAPPLFGDPSTSRDFWVDVDK